MSTISQQAIAPVARPAVREASAKRSYAWLWVALMTIAAAALRFWALERPAIWGDEAAVFWRTCGTYEQLLDILKNDGFAPLHYELYWVMHQYLTLTPFVMRFIPALAAVLMVPAVYFLARQLVSTRAALVAAAFAAASGHLGWHAHDAKMYMHFWLMCTLSGACLVWWLRKGGAIAWWCWVASSVAMVGLHSTGFAIIAISPLMVALTPRRNWRVFAAYALGLAIIAAGPLVYYTCFNQWAENIENQGWAASGIAWIDSTYGRASPPQVLRTSITQLLYGYDFPGPWWQWLDWVPNYRVSQEIPIWLGWTVLLALFPWPTRDRGRAASSLPQPWWRSSFILAAWAILPVYACYCVSFPEPPWPHELLPGAAKAIWASPTALAVAAAYVLLALYLLAPTNAGRIRLALQGLAVGSGLLLLATGIALASSMRPPGSVWVTRYMTFIWPAFAVAVAALLMRMPLWPIRWALIALLLVPNVAQCVSRIYWRQDAPVDLLTADILEAREPDSRMQAHFLSPHMAGAMQSMERRYYLFMASGEKPYAPEDFRSGNIRGRFALSTAATPTAVGRAIKDAPEVRRVVVWEQVPGPIMRRNAPPRTYPDRLARVLPDGWSRVSEDVHPFTGRWGWAPSLAWRRCEYHLIEDGPTTRSQ